MKTLNEFRISLADMDRETFDWLGGPDRVHLGILMEAFRFWCDTAPDGDPALITPLLLPAWKFWCQHAPDDEFEDVLDELVELDFRQQWRETRGRDSSQGVTAVPGDRDC
jgi:hypothetical protein